MAKRARVVRLSTRACLAACVALLSMYGMLSNGERYKVLNRIRKTFARARRVPA